MCEYMCIYIVRENDDLTPKYVLLNILLVLYNKKNRKPKTKR